FVRLSRNASEKILSILDDKSLQQLREVCKSVKQVVDSSILNTRKTRINKFELFEDGDSGETKLFLHYVINERDHSLWKIFLNTALPSFKSIYLSVINTAFGATIFLLLYLHNCIQHISTIM
ncbi:hypothetical protein PENTCL1PPCAC_1041, partial [Pristionchus entomophagus]